MLLVTDGENQKIIMGADKNTVIYIYNREEKTMSVGTFSDLQKGCDFFTRLSYYIVKEIVVFV